MRRIGVLETGRPADALVARHGAYPDMFRTLLGGQGNFAFVTYAIEAGDAVPEATDCDGWLITGSRHAVYEDHAWRPPLAGLVRAALSAGIPTVGICFGHQLMATALGGRVERSEKGWGVGLHDYDVLGGTALPTARLTLPAMHRDQVVAAPPGARLLATSDFCQFAGFAYGRAGLSLQGHPEFTADYQRDLIAARAGIIPAPTAAAALDSLAAKIPDTALAASAIARALA